MEVTCPTERSLTYGARKVLEDAADTFRHDSMGFDIDAQGCHPVLCEHGTGLWVCNPQLVWRNVMGIDATVVMDAILANDTCRDPQNGDASVQGEAHYAGEDWSVVFGGCSC